jgi:hypothetical protein
MNTYRIEVRREVQQRTLVRVVAKSESQARSDALKAVWTHPEDFAWEMLEGCEGDPFMLPECGLCDLPISEHRVKCV